MASTSRGRRKMTRKAKVDRISSLPDEILSHILSFLPTKCAVATSILSNRWKFLWNSVTRLHFEAPIIDDPMMNSTTKLEKHTCFKNFVDQVFRSCSSTHIQKLIMFMDEHCISDRTTDDTTWIDEAIKRKVAELDIHVYSCKWHLSVFSCITLKVLTFVNYQHYDQNNVLINLPCLKVLHIKGKSLNGFVETLIASCPVLEDLTLFGYLVHEEGYFMVTCPTLKRLQFDLTCTSSRSPHQDKVHIVAQNLQYLNFRDYFFRFEIKGYFSSVTKASVNIGEISLADWSLLDRLPSLYNLTYLEVILKKDGAFWSNCLPCLIDRIAPRLKVLSLVQIDVERADRSWNLPKSIPGCLSFHLSEIKIRGFEGQPDELQLIELFLLYGKVLQSLSISCRGLAQFAERKFYLSVMMSARASAGCQILFHGDTISNL